jgi:hypothetical protein
MVKFSPLLPQEAAVLFQNRLVCDVTEYKMDTPAGPVSAWRGSVAEEYFSITFIRGILTLSVVERECQLGQNAVNYAMSSALSEPLKVAGDNAIMATEAHFNYNLKQAAKEQKEISFTDVMVVLGWQYKEGAHIHYDLLATMAQ